MHQSKTFPPARNPYRISNTPRFSFGRKSSILAHIACPSEAPPASGRRGERNLAKLFLGGA